MNKINLLPWRAQFRLQQQKKFFVVLVSSILCAIMIVFICCKMLDTRMVIFANSNQVLNRQIKNLENKIQQIKQSLQQKQQLLQIFIETSCFKKQQQQMLELMNALSNIMPKNLYLTNIKKNSREIILIGKTSMRAEVALLMQRLEKIINPEKIQLTKINNAAKDDDNDFQITISRE